MLTVDRLGSFDNGFDKVKDLAPEDVCLLTANKVELRFRFDFADPAFLFVR